MGQEKLTTETLREAGLRIAEQSGQPLQRDRSQRRRQAYRSRSGERVLFRTSNDRVLTVGASSANPAEATLDIDDCDVVLIAMPTEKRGTSAVEAYWVPASVVAGDVKTAHQTWLDGNPNTNMGNKTYSIWFDKGVSESGMFREKWARYRLPTTWPVNEPVGAELPRLNWPSVS